jgi:hypothetical protein
MNRSSHRSQIGNLGTYCIGEVTAEVVAAVVVVIVVVLVLLVVVLVVVVLVVVVPVLVLEALVVVVREVLVVVGAAVVTEGEGVTAGGADVVSLADDTEHWTVAVAVAVMSSRVDTTAESGSAAATISCTRTESELAALYTKHSPTPKNGVKKEKNQNSIKTKHENWITR